jgi:hypothetical protein
MKFQFNEFWLTRSFDDMFSFPKDIKGRFKRFQTTAMIFHVVFCIGVLVLP